MAAKKTPPFPAYPAWTEAKFFGFLRSSLRTASSKWPPKYETVAAARRAYSGPDKRQKWEYKCAHCGQWHKQKDVQVDHIIPVGSLKTYEDLPGFVERLFCSVDGYQVLCSTCHQIKTNKEKEERNAAVQGG